MTNPSPATESTATDGPPTSRRRFLSAVAAAGTAGVAGLSGCLSGAPEEPERPWVERTAGDPPGTVVEGRVRLSRGQYATIPLRWPESEGPASVSGTMTERLSLPFDVFTFGPDALAAYTEGSEADGLSSLSESGTTRAMFRDVRLAHGEYAMVVDNTRFGGEPGYDEISVSVSVELEY
ncbi:twin-arginine translocation signal domain-containing protein [Halorarum halobium]|uniref:twin-arginine translocation signal domain-containing protein n=1 Tax=Halorarum halobium TaxID=3075121 RepID=UPI0028B223D3|nr:twin-arginine translocation signal domain-containing protein [Halobaculum sp. XH14]